MGYAQICDEHIPTAFRANLHAISLTEEKDKQEGANPSSTSTNTLSAEQPSSQGEVAASDITATDNSEKLSPPSGTHEDISSKTIPSIIRYVAEGPVAFNVKDQTVHLQKAQIIEEDGIQLEAEEVFLDWIHRTVTAFG